MKIDINLSHRNEYKKENNINTINIYEKLISNLQPMIQSQDNKISFLLVLCCLPIGQIDYFEKVFKCIISSYELGGYLIIFQYGVWVSSIAILLYGLVPRKYFEREIPEDDALYLRFIKSDYNRSMRILLKKIFYIRLSLIFIGIWSLLLIVEIIYIS